MTRLSARLIRVVVLASLGGLCSLAVSEGSALAHPELAAERLPLATVEGDQYLVEVEAPTLEVGKEGALRVVVSGKNGFKFNKDFPIKLELTAPPEGLSAPKLLLKRDDGKLDADGKFTFLVPLLASKAGEFSLEATLKFSVCNDDKCVVQRQTLRAKVTAR